MPYSCRSLHSVRFGAGVRCCCLRCWSSSPSLSAVRWCRRRSAWRGSCQPGLYVDLLALLFLGVYAVELSLSKGADETISAVNWVRYGLLLWIAGGTFDVDG